MTMRTRERVSISLNSIALERLKEMARREKRTLSNLASLIVEEWLEKNDDGIRKEQEQ